MKAIARTCMLVLLLAAFATAQSESPRPVGESVRGLKYDALREALRKLWRTPEGYFELWQLTLDADDKIADGAWYEIQHVASEMRRMDQAFSRKLESSKELRAWRSEALPKLLTRHGSKLVSVESALALGLGGYDARVSEFYRKTCEGKSKVDRSDWVRAFGFYLRRDSNAEDEKWIVEQAIQGVGGARDYLNDQHRPELMIAVLREHKRAYSGALEVAIKKLQKPSINDEVVDLLTQLIGHEDTDVRRLALMQLQALDAMPTEKILKRWSECKTVTEAEAFVGVLSQIWKTPESRLAVFEVPVSDAARVGVLVVADEKCQPLLRAKHLRVLEKLEASSDRQIAERARQYGMHYGLAGPIASTRDAATSFSGFDVQLKLQLGEMTAPISPASPLPTPAVAPPAQALPGGIWALWGATVLVVVGAVACIAARKL